MAAVGAGVVLLPMVPRLWGRLGPRLEEELLTLAFANPIFYAGCALILLLEWLIPARKEQKLLSVSLAQDFVWLFLEVIFRGIVVVTYANALRAFFRAALSFLVVGPVLKWPPWARIVLAVVVIDLLAYLHHWVRHKVPALWLFHTVHHSQRHLNMFTDLRYHIVEYAVAYTVRFLPMMMLGVTNPPIIAYALAHSWYTRFCHANIRTNLGWLRFVLVTPQSHRVHHSPHRRHWDRNFGVIFSVWDRVFGTHYRNEREYPRTGIPDEAFPHEKSAKIGALLVTPWRQLVYPFKAIWRREDSAR